MGCTTSTLTLCSVCAGLGRDDFCIAPSLRCPFLASPFPKAWGGAASHRCTRREGKLLSHQVLGLWQAGARAAKKLEPWAVRQLSGHLKPVWQNKTLGTFVAFHGKVCVLCSPRGGPLAQLSGSARVFLPSFLSEVNWESN